MSVFGIPAQRRISRGQEVAAVIMEPIMSEGGDNPFSAGFAQGIRSLTRELGTKLTCQTEKFDWYESRY